MQIINASHLARQALLADGTIHESITYLKSSKDTQCMFCGDEIKEGDKCNNWKPLASFNDGAHLKARNSARVCEHCSVVAINESEPKDIGLQLLSKGKFCVYSAEGTRRVMHKDALAFSLINPPEPPFVFTQGSADNAQHVIWKAHVSLSKDYFFVQHGNTTLTIRREKMIEGGDCMKRLKVLMDENELKTGKSKNPAFINTDINLKDINFGQIRSDVLALAIKNDEVCACVNTINKLKVGEVWGAIMITVFEPSTQNMTRLDIKLK